MSERGNLRVDVDGNATGFAQVMNSVKAHAKQAAGEINTQMSRSWGSIGKGFIAGVAGALSFEAIKGSFMSFLNEAKSIKDLSEQMEMGADSTQRWQKAADKLGLSMGGMMNVLSAIQQKRQEALTDPKAAALFERLGVARDSVRNTAGIDNSEFARMVLGAGQQSDERRAALADIIGRRGLKYAGAGAEFGGVSPDLSETDLAVAESAERAQRKAKSTMNRLWSGLFGGVGGVNDYVSDLEGKSRSGGFSMMAGLKGVLGLFSGRTTEGGGGAALPLTRGPRKKGESALGPDPVAEMEAARRQEMADQLAASEQRIEQAKRAHMTRQQKRSSMEKELAAKDALIAREEAEKAPGYLKGMDLEEWRNKQAIKINALKAERAGLDGQMKDDLREKPMTLSVDSLTKSGLVSTGGANFSVSKGTEKAQLDVLRSIDRKLSVNNPWKL